MGPPLTYEECLVAKKLYLEGKTIAQLALGFDRSLGQIATALKKVKTPMRPRGFQLRGRTK